MAGHDLFLGWLRRGDRRPGRGGPASAAAGCGAADGCGCSRDLGRMRGAWCCPRPGRWPASRQRTRRDRCELSGHSAGGHHRRGGNCAAVPQPPLAPHDVSAHHPGGVRRCRGRIRAAGQCPLQCRARMGRRGRGASGRGVTARVALSSGGGRRHSRVRCGRRGHLARTASGLGCGAVCRPQRGGRCDRDFRVRPGCRRRAGTREALAVLLLPGFGRDPDP